MDFLSQFEKSRNCWKVHWKSVWWWWIFGYWHLVLTKDFYLLKIFNDVKELGQKSQLLASCTVFFFVPNSKRSFTASCCILLIALCYGNWETFAVHIGLFFVSLGAYLWVKYVCGEHSWFCEERKSEKGKRTPVVERVITSLKGMLFFGERVFHLPHIPKNTKLLPCFYLKQTNKQINKQTKRWEKKGGE